MIRIITTTIAIVAGLLTNSAFAHHSFAAEFDINKPVEITGTLTEIKWSNPHGWIHMDVVGDDGNVVNWALETSSANGLIRRGWRKEDLPLGTVLLVKGWQARNGSPTANITSVTFTDGRRLWAGNASDDSAPSN